MSNYKEASRLGLRFTTPKGLLSVEQLWSLSLEDLDRVAIGLDAALEEAGNKSYLKKVSHKSKTLQLQRDIVVDVIQTLVDEQEAEKNALEAKRHNEKIDALIAKKKEVELESMSIEELEAMRK